MYAIHAAYRGSSRRRADYVRQVAEALGTSDSVLDSRILGAEDLVVVTEDADSATGVVLNLLQAGDFAVGIGAVAGDGDIDAPGDSDDASELATQLIAAAARAVDGLRKPGQTGSRIEVPGPGGVQAPGHGVEVASDITAAFTLVAHMLARRTAEGREATALMRQGYLQSEAAEFVGISKQAMSQRLAAAGWQAEQAGWQLAVHMLARTQTLRTLRTHGSSR